MEKCQKNSFSYNHKSVSEQLPTCVFASFQHTGDTDCGISADVTVDRMRLTFSAKIRTFATEDRERSVRFDDKLKHIEIEKLNFKQ
jgi:putative ribosome biogenesis GTPase RsgA